MGIEIINNTRGGIVMFIQAKKGNASNEEQIQVSDAELRRLTVLFIVYNIFIKMNILLFIYSLFMLRSNGYFTRKILLLHCFSIVKHSQDAVDIFECVFYNHGKGGRGFFSRGINKDEHAPDLKVYSCSFKHF